jgi:23S rRNA (guanosine2251-2'-O)-methyltransferase
VTGGGGEIIFGVEPVRELLAVSPKAVQVLFVGQREQARFAPEMQQVSKAGGAVKTVDEVTLSRMAGSHARHQGLVAQIREYPYASIAEVVAEKPDPLLLIDGVTDPRNLGAILRSAEGSGVRALILARDRTSPITPAAIKTSAGAWVHLKIARCGNVVQTLESLKEQGYWIAALVPGGSDSIYELDADRRLALVIGSEDRGVRQLVKRTVDFQVSIPMRGKVQSLNVAVATAVALYEIGRRRDAASRASSISPASSE